MANVLDFECNEYPQDLLRSIFEHQHNLAVKYIPIEQKNGLCLYDRIPADIDNSKAQARIKDMSWRAVEEVAEAFEALDLNEPTHFYEEMADALHFLVEKYLLCDFFPLSPGESSKYSDTTNPPSYLCDFFPPLMTGSVLTEENHAKMGTAIRNLLDIDMANFIKACGLTCNCLKNKPWKQSQMMTDVNKFRRCLMAEFTAFTQLCNTAGFTAHTLYNMYMRKNQVNQFRQRSNY